MGSSKPYLSFSVPIEIDGTERAKTGVALHNPHMTPVEMLLRLGEQDSQLAADGIKEISLGGRAQLARFPDELFPKLGLSHSRAVLTVDVDRGIVGMAIRQSPEKFATLPAVETGFGHPMFTSRNT